MTQERAATHFCSCCPIPRTALRWQAFTTLAYGARALGWFCYLTEVNYGPWTNWEDMVINRDGTRTRHYAMLRLTLRQAAVSLSREAGDRSPKQRNFCTRLFLHKDLQSRAYPAAGKV